MIEMPSHDFSRADSQGCCSIPSYVKNLQSLSPVAELEMSSLHQTPCSILSEWAKL